MATNIQMNILQNNESYEALNPSTSASITSYSNTNTSSIITGNNVQSAIDQLFTSVSNGKSSIASAITDMGVSTSGDSSFSTMAGNVKKISENTTATASDILSGKTAYSKGNLVTGNYTIPSSYRQVYIGNSKPSAKTGTWTIVVGFKCTKFLIIAPLGVNADGSSSGSTETIQISGLMAYFTEVGWGQFFSGSSTGRKYGVVHPYHPNDKVICNIGNTYITITVTMPDNSYWLDTSLSYTVIAWI